MRILSLNMTKSLSWDDSFSFYYCSTIDDSEGSKNDEYNYFMSLLRSKYTTLEKYITFSSQLLNALTRFTRAIVHKSISVVVNPSPGVMIVISNVTMKVPCLDNFSDKLQYPILKMYYNLLMVFL